MIPQRVAVHLDDGDLLTLHLCAAVARRSRARGLNPNSKQHGAVRREALILHAGPRTADGQEADRTGRPRMGCPDILFSGPLGMAIKSKSPPCRRRTRPLPRLKPSRATATTQK